jgi:hypothetical protein
MINRAACSSCAAAVCIICTVPTHSKSSGAARLQIAPRSKSRAAQARRRRRAKPADQHSESGRAGANCTTGGAAQVHARRARGARGPTASIDAQQRRQLSGSVHSGHAHAHRRNRWMRHPSLSHTSPDNHRKSSIAGRIGASPRRMGPGRAKGLTEP